MRRVSIILFFVTLLSLHSEAQNASISDAFEVAQAFMSAKGVTLNSKATTRSVESYTIFTGVDGKGYVIVSDGIVVGYDTENTATVCRLRANTRSETPKTPIEPMVKTEWCQAEPFCWEMPIVDGKQANAGCGPVALGQIMYYYKNPGCEALPNYNVPEGYVALEALPATTFNWDLILPNYYDSYTKEQGNEVAKLMKYIGCATQTWYKETGASYLSSQYFPLLGFSPNSYEVYGDMTDEEFLGVIDKELEQGRPILIAGYNTNLNGHWYVVDGRDDTGRYHINFGYKGNDGYFLLSPEGWIEGKSGPMLSYYWLNIPVMPDGWLVDDIKTVKRDMTDNHVYNLQGCKVGNTLEGLPKGVYIKDGKKQVVK